MGARFTSAVRQAAHYEMVMRAIAEGKYPGDQAMIAAQHAIAAWKG